MKLTKQILKKLIREEYRKLKEAGGEGSYNLEIHNTPVEKAKEYVNSKDVKLDNFEQNYLTAQKMAGLGKTQRKDMPVIDGTQTKAFQSKLKNGYIDINEPHAPTYNNTDPYPDGLSGKEAKEFLSRGLKDKSKNDDKVNASIRNVSVGKLKPIQKQIYLDKVINSIAKNGVDNTKNFLTGDTYFIASKDNYIIDGHHRYLAGVLIDPNLKVKVLSIDLPIKDLLPLSVAYGDAIGNQRNA